DRRDPGARGQVTERERDQRQMVEKVEVREAVLEERLLEPRKGSRDAVVAQDGRVLDVVPAVAVVDRRAGPTDGGDRDDRHEDDRERAEPGGFTPGHAPVRERAPGCGPSTS